jgi:hypothetical protein
VDLKDYILPSSDATFVSLRDQGLIDLASPKKSKILALIRMGEKAKGASLIHQKTREQELAAFADWVERSARDPRMRALPKQPGGNKAGPKRPLEVVRHARMDRVLESFTQNVWAMRFRCMSCHLEGTPPSQKLVAKHGKQVAWFKSAGPAATLDYLRTTKLIDVAAPEKSLLLLKPLREVDHGGGIKFEKGDQGYRAFLTFLTDYARVVKDGYRDAKSLPPADAGARRFGTDIWVKLANTPPAWGDKLVQVDVFAWDAERKAWEARPIATTDRKAWGKGKMWQHNLVLLAPKESERAKAWAKRKPSLPSGRYLLKAYLGGEKREYLGETEVRSAWPEGYGRMTVAEASRVKKPR